MTMLFEGCYTAHETSYAVDLDLVVHPHGSLLRSDRSAAPSPAAPFAPALTLHREHRANLWRTHVLSCLTDRSGTGGSRRRRERGTRFG